MTEFKELMALSKGFKIFFAVLSVVAVAGLLGAFALQSWAKDKIQHGEFVLNGVDKGWQERLESGFAYDSRLYFEKADFLLRSKVIAYIDIRDISWVSPIDKNAIIELKSQNRHIKFSTSQNLSEFNGQKLGVVEYKMDFSPLFKTILWYYVLIICLCLFVSFAYRLLYLTENGKISPFLNQISLPQALWQGYKAINPLYRHTFWIVFIALNLVFGFHTVQFLWGNHDWEALMDSLPILREAGGGRYTQNIIGLFLQNGMLLPLLNNVLAFVGLAFASVWLCMYLNIQKQLWVWLIVSFILTLQPFTLDRMYYSFQVSGLFIAVAIGILGFILAKKAGEYNINLNKPYHKPYALCLLSILCIHWGIASYQPFIDTALILLCGGIIAIIIDNKGDLKLSFYKSRFLIISVAFAAISYKIVLNILKNIGITRVTYYNQLISINELPERIMRVIKIGFGNLVNYDAAFLPLPMTILFAIFLVAFIIFVIQSKLNKISKLSIFVLFFGAVIGSVTHIILSKTFMNYGGIDYYGLMFLRVLIVALALKLSVDFIRAQKLFQNLLFILSAFLIWVCIVQDLYAQRVQKLAIDDELRLFNRVLIRLEQNPNFSYNKQYVGIFFGNFPNMREKYYSDKSKANLSLLNHNFLAEEVFYGAANMLMPKNVFNKYGVLSSIHFDKSHHHSFNPHNRKLFFNSIKRLHKAGILDKLEPFPHKDSVVVFEDIIVFVASKGNLDEIRASVKEQNNGATQ